MKKITKQTLLFLSMSGTAAACIILILFLLYKLIKPGLLFYVPELTPVIRLALLVLMIALGMLYALLLICISASFKIRNCSVLLLYYLQYLFPAVKLIGKWMGYTQAVCHAYIHVMNRLVLQKKIQIAPESILVLVPHCLQWDKCPHKITRDVSNCRQCGHCPIGTLLTVTRSMHTALAVATGGTLARQIIQQNHPKAIIAIACERDLISGMEDVMPLPVLGLLNSRPNGPCLNTDVDITALRNLLTTITGEEYERT